MLIIADTHVHFYPCYDLGLFLDSAFANLGSIESEVRKSDRSTEIIKVLFFTERSDCNFFQELSCSLKPSRDKIKGDYSLELVGSEGVSEVAIKILDRRTTNYLLLVPGRQIATLERVEVLSLCSSKVVPDGMPIESSLKAVTIQGGVPVLNWGLGKWMFGRGRIVDGLLKGLTSENVLLADSALRFLGFPEPRQFKSGRELGIKLIAGTDPLPFPGDEQQVATYCITCQYNIDLSDPVMSLRKMLSDPSIQVDILGNRNSPSTALYRTLKLKFN